MTDREAFNEFARGVAIAIGVAGVFVMLVAVTPKPEPIEKFKVVDTYHGCDLVRYTDRSNSWHYFLKCNDTDSN